MSEYLGLFSVMDLSILTCTAEGEAMSKQEFTVPARTANDGWYEVPKWLMEAGAIPHPRNKWTLPDGTVAQPGQTITLDGGVLSVEGGVGK